MRRARAPKKFEYSAPKIRPYTVLDLIIRQGRRFFNISVMKIFKNRLSKKMSDEYLGDSLLINIKIEVDKKFDLYSIIDEFNKLKG